MTKPDFHVKLKIRIDWGDVDSFGHVNNISIFKYIQSARVNYVEKTRLTKMHHDIKIGPILASCKCQFKKPLFYPGHVTVHSRVDSIKNTSFCIYHQIVNDENQVVAEAHDIIVVYDFTANIKVELPLKTRNRIEKLENKTF